MEAYIGTCVWGMWRHTLGMNARIMKQAKRRACSARKMTAITCCPLPAHAIMLHACYTLVTRLYKSTRTLCTIAQLHARSLDGVASAHAVCAHAASILLYMALGVGAQAAIHARRARARGQFSRVRHERRP